MCSSTSSRSRRSPALAVADVFRFLPGARTCALSINPEVSRGHLDLSFLCRPPTANSPLMLRRRSPMCVAVAFCSPLGIRTRVRRERNPKALTSEIRARIMWRPPPAGGIEPADRTCATGNATRLDATGVLLAAQARPAYVSRSNWQWETKLEVEDSSRTARSGFLPGPDIQPT